MLVHLIFQSSKITYKIQSSTKLCGKKKLNMTDVFFCFNSAESALYTKYYKIREKILRYVRKFVKKRDT